MKSLAPSRRLLVTGVHKAEVLAGAGLAAASAALHLLPFLFFGANPLGYDTGFYRRYLTQPFVSFPDTPVPGLGSDASVPRILLDFLRLLHLPTDFILYGSYLVFFTLMPVLLFAYLRPKLGARGAALAGVFLLLSSVAYEGYWYMLFKNALALDLVLIAFIAFERRSAWALLLVSALIAFTHETTALIYMFTLGVLFVLARARRRELALCLALTASCFLLVNFSLVHQVSVALPAAIFLDWPTYVNLSLPFIIVLAAGARGLWKKSIPLTLLALSLASFAFPLFRLPFYERIFFFCDLALAALAAYGAEYLLERIEIDAWSREGLLKIAVLSVAGGLLLGNLWSQVASLRPLVSASDLQAIEAVAKEIPPDATLLTISNEAPWYEGWTLSHVAAPGLLHDTHNLESWNAFWSATSSAEKISFLNSFPAPLYVSTLGDISDLVGTAPACLVQVSAHVLYSTCSN
jgi:hypothetical protein